MDAPLPPAARAFLPGTFEGQVAFVTGGGTGLGLEISRGLAALGATVVIASDHGHPSLALDPTRLGSAAAPGREKPRRGQSDAAKARMTKSYLYELEAALSSYESDEGRYPASHFDVDDVPDAQRIDLALLLSLIEDPLALAQALTKKDRKRLRSRSEMADANHPAWADLTEELADRGRAGEHGVGLDSQRGHHFPGGGG